MTYQVLARKYRPQNFDQVVGQEHVTGTLKNAILKERIHHAYLFTGVRGTGKTSLARILARSLQCEKGPTLQPCEQCSACLSILKGTFLDVNEIDGASNTSVDSVRELREQIKYMPASGRYKIYIIDEVHMLSTSAFNALLKTLEEPPPHVLFIFATTEVQKIPLTILSRCQRFDLRRLSQVQLRQRLEEICSKEEVKGDETSFDLLARAAEGSMRDAQSLLDMAIGLCGEQLQAAKIQEMLGLTEWAWVMDLTRRCMRGQIKEALAQVQDLYQRGYDLRQIANQWLEYLHELTLLKSAGAKSLAGVLSSDRLKEMEEIAAEIDLSRLQIACQTVYRASEEIFRSESPKILFDLLVVKLVYGNPFQNLAQVLEGEQNHADRPVAFSQPQVQKEVKPPSTVAAQNKLPDTSASPPLGEKIQDRDELLQRAFHRRPQLKALLDHAIEKGWEGHVFWASYAQGSIYADLFEEKKGQIAEVLSELCGTKVTARLVRKAVSENSSPNANKGGPPLPDDPLIQQAVEILNATVHEVRKT